VFGPVKLKLVWVLETLPSIAHVARCVLVWTTGQKNMTIPLTLRSLGRPGSIQNQLPLDWG
jgi:ABC-type proline/glycine betaine transport system permease subunit